jgi:uncharacterized protein (DUF2141 family)
MIFASCAQIVKPSGGPQDKKPPHVNSYAPDSAAVFFKSKKVSIVFDEFIQLKDLNGQLVISPPMERTPDIKVKGKVLEIVFRSPLKDSTTYTISLGSAVVDLHESNAVPDFKYVFSTGSYVDSLWVSGTVTNAFTQLPEKGVMVMLYNKLDDSIPYKSVPAYFGRTGASGAYRINHIKPGIYKVFALRDQNGNYKYNPGEMIGFQEKSMELNNSQDNVNMLVFKEEPSMQKLKRAYQSGYGKIMLAFTSAAERVQLRSIRKEAEPLGTSFVERNGKSDTLTYWFVPPATDSVFLEVGDDSKVYDTLRYKLISREKFLSQHKTEKYFLKVQSNVSAMHLFDLNSQLRLSFSAPVPGGIKDASRMFLTEDTLKDNLFKQGSFNFTDDIKRTLSWKYDKGGWKENRKYHLLILPGAFSDMYGFTNDTLKADFKTAELRFYGTLKLNVNAPAGHYILQLLDDKDGIVREESFNNNHEFYFEYLSPMNYKVRLITDSNENKKWDTGSYLKKKQAEAVIYYKDPITIRSNWDQETVWIVK